MSRVYLALHHIHGLGDGGNVEPFDIVKPFFSITINHIVYGTFVVFLEDIDIENILADKHFVCYANYFIFAVFIEDNHIVYV